VENCESETRRSTMCDPSHPPPPVTRIVPSFRLEAIALRGI